MLTRLLRTRTFKSLAAIGLLWLAAAAGLAVLHRFYPDSDLFTGPYFVQLTFSGIVLGCVYALIALGYTMVYGVIQLINFAHGDVYMLGAYFGYFFLRLFIRTLYFDAGLPLFVAFFLAMICSMAICAACGVLMEKFAYLPLRKSTRIAALITAVGMSFFLENLGIIVFTANPRSFAPNSYAVYVVEASADSQFRSAKTYSAAEKSRINVSEEPDLYLRIKAKSEAGESGWSETVRLAPGSETATGVVTDYDDISAGVPAPVGIFLSRLTGDAAGNVEVNWHEIPKKHRSIRPIFGDSRVFVPLDFGLGVRPAGAQDDAEVIPHKRLGFTATPVQIVVIAVTALVLVFLWWLISKTKFGMAMRAVSFDKDVTRLMGIDTDTVISKTFALGSALAAVAGCLVGLYWESIFPLMGILPGIKAFVAAVVGGIGSIPGAAAGGLIMGVSEFLVKGYIPANLSALSDAVAFAFLIVVLLVKPSGLLGRSHKEKV